MVYEVLVLEIKDLKLLFASESLVNATVTPYIMGKGYVVAVNTKGNKQYLLSGQRSNGKPRVFKSIDAAVKNTADIGFHEVIVRMDQLDA